VVSCRGFGAARTDGRDGAKGFNSPFDLGQHDGSNAAITMAIGQHNGSNASITLVEHDGTDAAVTLVVMGKNSR
jgi:hypothetical protein